MCIHKRERSELYKSKTDKTEKKKKNRQIQNYNWRPQPTFQ